MQPSMNKYIHHDKCIDEKTEMNIYMYKLWILKIHM